MTLICWDDKVFSEKFEKINFLKSIDLKKLPARFNYSGQFTIMSS